MNGPLLSVENLTIRFGGLTAVENVDLHVEPGQIFAVIGPNGAGKTTVFNAVTGICEPTAGAIRFEGRDLRRPFRRKLLAGWAIVGLTVGLLLLLFAANLDLLWLATVKANFRGRAQGFSLGEAWRDLEAYMAAEPRVEVRAGRFFVVSGDGETTLGSAATADEAERRRVEALGRPGVRATMAGPRRLRAGLFLLGALLGAAGGWALWRQTRRTPAWIASQGVSRTFQNIRLFQQMTVLENVLVGLDRRMARGLRWWAAERRGKYAAPAGLAALVALLALLLRTGWLGAGAAALLLCGACGGAVVYVGRIARMGAFSRHDRSTETRARAEARDLLGFVGLEARADGLAKNLSYGDQRRLEIARALATRPKLLLLDEPAAGMNPSETAGLMKLIRDIRERGTTTLIIEHDMRVVMGISDRIAVLEYGRKIAEGTPAEVRADPAVIAAYLGKDEVA